MRNTNVPGFKNPQRRNAFIWLFIALIGLLMVLAPFIFDIDIMDGGGPLIFIGIFVFIAGILVSILFFGRSSSLGRMFRGEGLLAHWRYDSATWGRHSKDEYAYRKDANKVMFFLIGGMCLLTGLIFFILDPENGIYVFLVMLVMTVILGITAVLTAWLPYRRSRKRISEAFISREGVYINGQLHTWRGLGSRLERVNFINGNALEFAYSYITRAGRQEYVFHVPMPPGEEKRALFILNYFKNPIV